MRKHIDLIIEALDCYQGDNAARARSAFKNCNPEDMQCNYGQSGETKQQILDTYENHERACKEAKTWIQKIIKEEMDKSYDHKICPVCQQIVYSNVIHEPCKTLGINKKEIKQNETNTKRHS